jgi:hypothetical protein
MIVGLFSQIPLAAHLPLVAESVPPPQPPPRQITGAAINRILGDANTRVKEEEKERSALIQCPTISHFGKDASRGRFGNGVWYEYLQS